MSEYQNPLPCGCGVKGRMDLESDDIHVRYKDLHVSFCPMHAAAQHLLDALKAILEHVEDETFDRIGMQCTLCHTYRMIGHEAIQKAGVRT